MIKKLLLLTFLYIPFSSLGQKSMEGKIFNSSGVTVQLNGDYFTYFKNNKNAIGNLSGQTITENIEVPLQGFIEGVLDIQKGVYFSKAKESSILFSLSGERISDLVFSKYKPFVTNNTVVKISKSAIDKEYLYIDTEGKVLVSYDKKRYYGIFGIDITKGFYNTDSFIAKEIFFSNEDFRPFSEGLTAVKHPESKLWGFIDQQLSLVIPANYKQVHSFFEGKASVQNENGLWGFINQKGEEVVPFKFSIQPSKFSSGLAKVTAKDRKIGYIDVEGNIIIEPSYAFASDFYKGFALVRKSVSDPILMIDTTGKTVSQFESDLKYVDMGILAADPSNSKDLSFHYSETLVQLVEMGKGVFIDKHNRYGIIDKDGETILPFDYLMLKDYSDGKMFAIQDLEEGGSITREYYIIKDTGDKLIKFIESKF